MKTSILYPCLAVAALATTAQADPIVLDGLTLDRVTAGSDSASSPAGIAVTSIAAGAHAASATAKAVVTGDSKPETHGTAEADGPNPIEKVSITPIKAPIDWTKPGDLAALIARIANPPH